MIAKKSAEAKNNSCRIDGIGITHDRLTSRGGLTLFVKYIMNIGILAELGNRFGRLRKSAKGAPVQEVFKQVLCFLFDGTSRHLTWFDALKRDEGYAGGIETAPEDMASSHAIKRFFQSFNPVLIWLFRPLLQQLFLWRLRLEQPETVVLGLDTMVMDNNEAEARQGVQPTYKKVKGFQPLQLTWGRYIVDAVFRGGKKHSNHGDTAAKTILHIVAKIRTGYRGDVPIVLLMDSGFFDQKLFELCERLEVGYVCGGRLSKDVKNYVTSAGGFGFGEYRNGAQVWDYLEFGHHPASWGRYRRAVFCRPRYEDRQALLEFARPDTVIYSNLGMGQRIDGQLKAAGHGDWRSAAGLIGLYHRRGRDELVFRSLKDFGFEELPFKRFTPNAALYYTMLLAFFLCEAYKADVLSDVVGVEAYPTTLRRRAVDFAAKIVRSGGQTLLKVTETVWESLTLSTLWARCSRPPEICWD